MCGCLGLTSDIRVKAWKGKSICRQTSEGEASPAQVGPREPEQQQQRRSLLICQIWMEQTAWIARLKQVHCWVRYTHRFCELECKQFSAQSGSSGLTKVVCPAAAIKVHMSVHQSTWRACSVQPVNCFTVLEICPCTFIFTALKKHGAHSERREKDDRKRELTPPTAVGPEWPISNLMYRITQIKQILFTCRRVYWNLSLTKVKIELFCFDLHEEYSNHCKRGEKRRRKNTYFTLNRSEVRCNICLCMRSCQTSNKCSNW